MIQELFGSASTSSSSPLFGRGGASCNGFGGSAHCNGDRKFFSITSNGGIILEGTPAAPSSSSPSPLPTPNTSSSSATVPSATKAAGAPCTGAGSNGANSSSDGKQNLRCPRCDSSNTKFCYYNNYNLTQPRHFCKTCRRYWTKGGALRNVPIGGGCRKNKASNISSSAAKSSASKYKTISASGFTGGFDHELPLNPIMWGSPHSSHILALLRGEPHINTSPNPNPSSFIKQEVDHMMFGGHVMTESASGSAGGISMSTRGLGLDPSSHLPSIGLCSSFIRNTQQRSSLHQNHAADHQSHQTNYNMLDEAQSGNAIHALYQRLKLSTGAGTRDTDRPHVVAPNMQDMANTSNPSSLALESCPAGVGSDQLGYWSNNNNTSNLCWLDLPTSNGPYP